MTLPDPQSDDPPTEWERQLLPGVGMPGGPIEMLMLRALRSGYEAGRRSVLDAGDEQRRVNP